MSSSHTTHTARVHSVNVTGIQCTPVEIEVDITAGMPQFIIVGLPDTAVSEARDRVRAAIKNSGFLFPRTRVTVNLAPAHMRKEGALFDVPIAVGILAAQHLFPAAAHKALRDSLFVGELALDGRCRPIRGILPIMVEAQRSSRRLVFPEAQKEEAALIANCCLLPAPNLCAIVDDLCGSVSLAPAPRSTAAPLPLFSMDMAEVIGQHHAKRALEIAAAGSHHLLLVGPPGSGKSMLARAVASILPSMTPEEQIETRMIHSISASPSSTPSATRPFRSPHHTTSAAAVTGGGPQARPGEMSLAHNGVLFLDEFAEFRRDVIESLREPLESGEAHIVRVRASVRYPAKFMLIAAMNPCPCGFASDEEKECQCTPLQLQYYQKKISGPIIDRIDLVVHVPRLAIEKLQEKQHQEEESATIRARVAAARVLQHARLSAHRTNRDMTQKEVEMYCVLDQSSQQLLCDAMQRWHLSPRSYFRIMKVARTIADLAGEEQIRTQHIAEALQYRSDF